MPGLCREPLLTSAEKLNIQWFEDKIAPLYSAANPTKPSFGAVGECQNCSLSVDKQDLRAVNLAPLASIKFIF